MYWLLGFPSFIQQM